MSENSKPSSGQKLSHINHAGEANMVDVSDKPISSRSARARGRVRMAGATAQAIRENAIGKGEVLAVARIAGISAAKKCSELIPLCHPLALTKIQVEFSWHSDTELNIQALCKVSGQTGVEMEALTAVSVSALTIYDMCKAMDRDMEIGGICLLDKQGGRSGQWSRDDVD